MIYYKHKEQGKRLQGVNYEYNDYNDCLNEGGEGYMPPYPVTAEAYEKALRILSGK